MITHLLQGIHQDGQAMRAKGFLQNVPNASILSSRFFAILAVVFEKAREKSWYYMTQFAKVAEKKDFVVKKSSRVTIEGVDIALFSLDGKFHAVQNDCPHQHFSAMHEGILNGREITCPMHGWTFDLTTGKATIGGGRLKIYEVKTEGNDILVELPENTPDWAKS